MPLKRQKPPQTRNPTNHCMHYHLKTRIAITVSLLILSLMALLSWMALSYFEDEFKAATFSHFEETLSVAANALSSRVEHAQRLLGSMREAIPADVLGDPGKIQAFLEEQDMGLLTFDNGIMMVTCLEFIPGKTMSLAWTCLPVTTSKQLCRQNDHTSQHHSYLARNISTQSLC